MASEMTHGEQLRASRTLPPTVEGVDPGISVKGHENCPPDNHCYSRLFITDEQVRCKRPPTMPKGSSNIFTLFNYNINRNFVS